VEDVIAENRFFYTARVEAIGEVAQCSRHQGQIHVVLVCPWGDEGGPAIIDWLGCVPGKSYSGLLLVAAAVAATVQLVQTLRKRFQKIGEFGKLRGNFTLINSLIC
jgi:hypothetical protein